MKCVSCGGNLTGQMNTCPYCQTRQDIDLRKVHFRDLGFQHLMFCPDCEVPLHALEVELDPPIILEHCTTCRGLFFNPGELEHFLDSQTNPIVRLDVAQLNQLLEDFGPPGRQPLYRKCPACYEPMSPHSFGRLSGVVLDFCGRHGVWLDGGELRRLTEWWRVGGKLHYQVEQQEKVELMYRDRPIPDFTAKEAGEGEDSRGGGITSDERDMALWGVALLVAGVLKLLKVF